MPLVRNVYVVCTYYASGEFVGVCTSLEAAQALLNKECNKSKKPLTFNPDPDGNDNTRWVAVDDEGNDWYGTINLRTLVFPS